MQWRLNGPATAINLGSGLPYYRGLVIYPSPRRLAGSAPIPLEVLTSVRLEGASTGCHIAALDTESRAQRREVSIVTSQFRAHLTLPCADVAN
jgi:hypothetical protein